MKFYIARLRFGSLNFSMTCPNFLRMRQDFLDLSNRCLHCTTNRSVKHSVAFLVIFRSHRRYLSGTPFNLRAIYSLRNFKFQTLIFKSLFYCHFNYFHDYILYRFSLICLANDRFLLVHCFFSRMFVLNQLSHQ